MFDNIGSKIKIMSKILFWLYALGISAGTVMLFISAGNTWGDESTILYIFAFSLLIGGFITAFAIGWIVYGFGELVEKAQYIDKTLRKDDSDYDPSAEEELI